MGTEDLVHWDVQVSRETDTSLRCFLQSQGAGEAGLSELVERAVAGFLLDRTLADIHERNRDVDPAILEAEIEDAIREVRADKRGLSSHVEQRR